MADKYDKNKENSYIIHSDKNTLYPWQKVPIGDLKLIKNPEIIAAEHISKWAKKKSMVTC